MLVGVPIYLFPVNLMPIMGEGLKSKNRFTLGEERPSAHNHLRQLGACHFCLLVYLLFVSGVFDG